MHPTKKVIDKENDAIIDDYDYMSSAASTQDCTGLIPANPFPEYGLDSYEAIYPYRPPKILTKKKSEDS